MRNKIMIEHLACNIKGVLLWGGRSKARILNAMLKENELPEATIIFDETLERAEFEHQAFFTNDISILSKKLVQVSHYVVCLGAEHGFARKKTAEYLELIGLKPLILKHYQSFVDPTSDVSDGCQIMPAAVIHKFCTIGKHTIINTNATIDHECIIGDGVHIMGSAAVAGKVKIENFATIGTNATILPFLTIGEGALIGAGSVVTRDVEPYTVVVGNPSRKIRDNSPKFFVQALEKLIEMNNSFPLPPA